MEGDWIQGLDLSQDQSLARAIGGVIAVINLWLDRAIRKVGMFDNGAYRKCPAGWYF
jgi:hypothetical protein